MLVGQDRAGKTSLMRRLLGLPFDKDQPSTTGIDVNVIELTEQNAEDPWKKREVKEFMTSESEAKTVLYKKTAEYLNRGVKRNSEWNAPKPVKPLLREEITNIKSQRSTEHDQNEVLRVFVSDFAGQSIYYDTHGCFVKPHCPYVLVHDLSLEFDKPAVPKFKDRAEEEEIEMNNPHLNTNLDNFTSWLKFLQGSGECQDQQFSDNCGHCATAKGENFKRPPVVIALTHSDKVKGNDSKIDCVQRRIAKILSEGKYENVIPEFFLIDSTLEGDDGDDVRKLRRNLFDFSNGVLNRELLMPVKWLGFEAALSRKLSLDCKYIPVDEAKREAEASGVEEFDQAIKFLHRQGVVVHHSGSSKVVLDPPWLMNRFTKVITMPCKLDALSRHTLSEYKEKGILFQECLERLEDAKLLKELMQKFNLICPCQHDGKPAFYVPSVAPAMIPGKGLNVSSVPSLFVTFPRQLVPISLFTKLQVKLISEWEKRFPNQQARPSFYCNYSLLALIMDGNVYDICLIDLHEFIKVTVFPKKDGNYIHHFKFASYLKATLKKCLDDLKSPDQLLFSMTSYDFEVKCTCCFGKEERRCSRHGEIQCHSDRCGHRHFWKLSDLRRFYNDQKPALCQSDNVSSEVFDVNSVKIWLDTAMVEDNSKFEWPNETSSGALTSGPQSTRDSYPERSINGPPDIDLIPKEAIRPREISWDGQTVDSVLLTANDFEFRATYEILLDPAKTSVKNLGPVYFGRVGDIKVALILTEMGANNKLGSQEIGEKSIRYLKPKTIICLGVCFGLQKGKQKLGDLLISKHIQRYSQVRVNPDGTKKQRSEGRPVESILFSLFKDSGYGWTSPKNSVYPVEVQHGVVLSGPQLVDNKQRCEELKVSFPEALGGEMEGEGLINLDVPCIVCKSIVDWADGSKKKEWQPFGAKVAASFVEHVLQSKTFENAYKERTNEEDVDGIKAHKKVGDINSEVYRWICRQLRKGGPGKDCVTMAGKMGYTEEKQSDFQLEADPAHAILRHWGTEEGNSLQKLIEIFEEMKRDDLVKALRAELEK